ncbi:MAG TPA: RNB domain-containing ribonuclease [Candidatus Saccharimonadales bacterium]
MAEQHPDNPTTTTPELHDAAYAEAAVFALPEGWQDGRKVREGMYAVDKPISPDVDDVIGLSADPAAGETLHVGIVDLGAFLRGQIATSRYAQRRAWTFYKYDGSVAAPMIPRPISEHALSLLDGELRPVISVHMPVGPRGVAGEATISREAVRAKRIGFSEADELLVAGDSPDALALRGLERVAQNLRAARETSASDNPELEFSGDIDDEWLYSIPDFGTSSFIVKETMIAANSAMAKFMYEHNIPALYRNDVVPADVLSEITDPRQRQELLGLFARASWGTTPLGHFHLQLPMYMHFTSPLRRFADFVNHCNLAAYLDGLPFPYPQERLDRIAERMNQLEIKERLALSAQRTARSRRSRPLSQAAELLIKMENEEAHPGDLAIAMFGGATGNPEAIAEARTAAAHYVARHVQLARSVLGVGIQRGALTLRPSGPDDPISRSHLVIEHTAGNVLPYELEKGKVARAMAEAVLLGQIVGIEVVPEVPERFTPRGRILWDGAKYLRGLHRRRRIWFSSQIRPLGKGSNIVEVYAEVGISNTLHTRTVTGQRDIALRQATRELIEELDLIDNPPPQRRKVIKGPPQQQKRDKSEALTNPIMALQARMQTNGGDRVEFSFPNRANECVARVTDIDGTPYEVTVIGANGADAKRKAAAALLAQMPPRPLNKRGDMWQDPA